MLLFCTDSARLGHFLIPMVVYKHLILFFFGVFVNRKNRKFRAFYVGINLFIGIKILYKNDVMRKA